MLRDRVWMEQPVSVVSDDGVVLAVLLEPGSPMLFPDHPDPHPWRVSSHWRSTHVLQLDRTADPCSVWKLFEAGAFRGWYVNFEAPIHRGADGFETHDHGLDIVVSPGGGWRWKDVEDLDRLLATGRLSSEQVAEVRSAARTVEEDLTRGHRWWSRWDEWAPVG